MGHLIMNNSELEGGRNRKFGLFIALVSFFISLYFWSVSSVRLSMVMLFLTFIFLTLSNINSSLLSNLRLVWIKLGKLLGRIINPVIYTLFFLLLFTPISLITKLFGRDELNLSLENKNTAWIPKSKLNWISSFEKQF